jgi:hypothetical protein
MRLHARIPMNIPFTTSLHTAPIVSHPESSKLPLPHLASPETRKGEKTGFAYADVVLVIVAPGLKHRRLRDDVGVAALGGVGGLDAWGLDVACAAALGGRAGRVSFWIAGGVGMGGQCRGAEMRGMVEGRGDGRKESGGAYAGGVGAVALVAEGAFADDVAVGVAREGEGGLVVGFHGKGRRGGGVWWGFGGLELTACRPG